MLLRDEDGQAGGGQRGRKDPIQKEGESTAPKKGLSSRADNKMPEEVTKRKEAAERSESPLKGRVLGIKPGQDMLSTAT